MMKSHHPLETAVGQETDKCCLPFTKRGWLCNQHLSQLIISLTLV